MKVDWKKGPGFKRIDQINLPEYTRSTLDNGIQCIELNQGTQEVFKLDIVFRGARLLEHKKIVSKFTSQLMREGTKQFTSPEIAEAIDFYGASLRMAANLDYNFISLSGLSKHLTKLMPVLADVLYEPLFPDNEVEKSKKNSIQKLQMDLSKNELVNYRVFTETIFGKEHIYGYNTEEIYIENISREDLIKHHAHAFGTDNCFMLLGGKLPSDAMTILNQSLGQNKVNSVPFELPGHVPLTNYQQIKVNSKNEHQASIRIGRKMFNKHHPDFGGFFVLNTILGGYFGSRLMETVREDLGLTYNIYSVLDNMVYDGYFYIETDVTIESISKTIDEIYNQMELLKLEPVKEEELTMVKNYLLGNFLNLVDGPLNTLSFLRSMELDYSNKADFDELVHKIKEIDAYSIQQLAIAYFDRQHMVEVIVSKSENN